MTSKDDYLPDYEYDVVDENNEENKNVTADNK